MDTPPLQTVSHFVLALSLAASSTHLLEAQTKQNTETPAVNTGELLKAIDQLIEQNRRLEEQNRQLVEQIIALRQALAAQAEPSASATPLSGKPAGKVTEAAAASTVVPPKNPQARGTQSPPASPGPASAKSEAAAEAAAQTSPDASVPSPPNTNQGANTENANGFNGSPALFGEWNPGEGFTVAKTRYGQLDLSGYMVMRYLNQLPPDQHATDHLGRPIPVQARQDFQFHRVLLYAKGWLLNPKFHYLTVIWTVNDTTQVAVGGALWYDFNKHLTLGGGYTALPGTQSMQGSHPYWPTYDRAMADEFFRPFYTQGPFGSGELAPRLIYRFAAGNNLSLLGVPATQLDRSLSFGASLTWLPTTGEFGPRGAFGDFEEHEKLATRFNLAYTRSREPRYAPLDDAAANTTIRLADSLNIFDPGALAPGVTVTKVTYQMASSAAGMKYHGLWLQGEGYARRLSDIDATGPLPVGVIRDFGFYAQGSYMVVPKTIELYAGTSYVFSLYGKPKEFFYGGNYYPWRNRNIRLNVHIISVDHSPVNSTFGFYMGQITGTVVAIGMTALY
jgi:hypothetical protein